MQKIVPHLWFDKEAKEAATLYCSLFEDARITSSTLLKDTPSGDAEVVNFTLAGLAFSAISAGPYFRFNPSISLMVSCNAKEEVDRLWQALSEGGTELMPLGEYPFSPWYSWVQDRFGLSWQLMLTPEPTPQKIRPNFLFSGPACGKAEEAMNYYAEIFENAHLGFVNRYADGEATAPEAKINYAEFDLEGLAFTAMDNGYPVDFNFNEAFSLMVKCKDQAEIDYFWDKLSAVPEAEQCGWVKDAFGVSWQVVPEAMDRMMSEGTAEELKRITEAFLSMKKFDLATLERAKQGQ